MFEKAGIIGLGLIGGSLAKALKKRCGVKTVVASNRNIDSITSALSEGVIDLGSDKIDEIFNDCDIVFICTPVDKVYDYAQRLKGIVPKACLVTDVGSTKFKLYEKMLSLRDDFIYIGGHPMTGSEKFRYSAAKEHLFENAYYILTPDEKTPAQYLESYKKLVLDMGAIPVIVSPENHDHITSAISHFPHIIASALVNNVKSLDKDGYMRLLAAGGFKDITRIASSSPDMWESICFDNKDEILSVLSSFEEIINNFRKALLENDKQNILNYFGSAKAYRDALPTITSFVKLYDIVIDVLDKPGSIADVTAIFSANGINIKNISIVNNREQDLGVLNVSFDNEIERQKSLKLLRSLGFEAYEKN